MMNDTRMLSDILSTYRINEVEIKVEPFGKGLINYTWKVSTHDKEYILQRINDAVFKQPSGISENISLIAQYLKQHFPDYYFVAPLTTLHGEEFIKKDAQGYFRMFPLVPGSHSKDVAATPQQAYEAAIQFGRFTRLLSGFDVNKLNTTLPSFHDLSLRYQRFVAALKNGNKKRITETHELSKTLTTLAEIVTEYERIQSNPAFKKRVTHHDTKISNVLFDDADKAICVIDLDTVMPGYFISDVGDMMRTYLCPVSEEVADFSKIEVREDFYHAIVEGYSNEMKDELNQTEKQYFFYAGKFMIYMQAIRFLTDYLNDDVYYGAKYNMQNFVRAKNQTVLLQKLIEKQESLSKKD